MMMRVCVAVGFFAGSVHCASVAAQIEAAKRMSLEARAAESKVRSNSDELARALAASIGASGAAADLDSPSSVLTTPPTPPSASSRSTAPPVAPARPRLSSSAQNTFKCVVSDEKGPIDPNLPSNASEGYSCSGPKILTVPGCGHQICKECAKDEIATQIMAHKDGIRWTGVPCPYGNGSCKHKIPDDYVFDPEYEIDEEAIERLQV